MDSPSAPPVPDPVATANAQGAANIEAARTTANLNRYDQVTPWGTQTWANDRTFDQTGYDTAMSEYQASLQSYNQAQQAATAANAQTSLQGEDGTSYTGGVATTPLTGGGVAPTAPDRDSYYSGQDHWTSTTALDPRIQQLLDSYIATSQGLEGTTQTALGNVNSVLGHPIDYNALPEAATLGGAYGDSLTLHGDTRNAINSNLAGAQGLVDQSRGLASSQLDRLASVYGSEMDFSGAPAMPTADAATRKRVEDAVYAMYQSRLDPRYGQAENATRSTLMNRGITEGSEAWKNELDNFGRGKNDAYQQAMWDSVLKGGTEMERLFNMGMSARKQGVGEIEDIRNQATKEGLAGIGANSALTTDLRGQHAEQQGRAVWHTGGIRDDG